jgi:hypothetical protein
MGSQRTSSSQGKMSFCYNCRAFMPCTVHLLLYFFINFSSVLLFSLFLFSFFLFSFSVLLLSPVAVIGSVETWPDRWRFDRIGGDLTGSLEVWPDRWRARDVTGSLEIERCPSPRGWAVRRPPPSSVGTEITDPRPQPQRQALAFGEERERWKEEREEKYKLLKK